MVFYKFKNSETIITQITTLFIAFNLTIDSTNPISILTLTIMLNANASHWRLDDIDDDDDINYY